ncbi:MAG: hypothetical protein IT285_11595, partial [Bdellovibrionales bacterium]|nr:hypothetical protein [Bdellovibrionales bacterium]
MTLIRKPVPAALALFFLLFGTGCLTNGAPVQSGDAVYPWTQSYASQNPATSFDDLPDTDEDEEYGDVEDVDISDSDSDDEEDPGEENISPIEREVHGIGYTDVVSFYADTNQILKVRFIPSPQESNVAGTGFSPTYTGLGVYIKVGQVEKPTPLLYNGAAGGEPQVSPTLSFAGAYSNSCAATDNTCRTRVTIRVIKPNYDHYCVNYPGGFMNGNGQFVFPCSPPGYTHVYKTHPW